VDEEGKSCYNIEMNLTEALLPNYLSYIFPDEPVDKARSMLDSWQSQIRSGKRQLENYFVKISADKKILAALHLSHFHEATYAIQLPMTVVNDASVKSHDIDELIEEACVRLKTLGAKRGEFRLTEKAHLLSVASKLPSLGFKPSHVRVEFRAPIDGLPGEKGSPLSWVSVSEAGPFHLEKAAQILEQAGDGDPDWNSEDNNLELLKSYLADKEFQSTLECVQIGMIENAPAAIVIAQVIPSSGWSRITYMGLIPKFRKQGLGKWIHRHGFEMMRAQGGKLYHGGTVRGNHGMEALFRSHGCKKFRTMQEWILHL
jgi:hypothetical protein